MSTTRQRACNAGGYVALEPTVQAQYSGRAALRLICGIDGDHLFDLMTAAEALIIIGIGDRRASRAGVLHVVEQCSAGSVRVVEHLGTVVTFAVCDWRPRLGR